MGLKRPHWRKTTWVILAFNLLMLIWLVAGVGSASSDSLAECAKEADEVLREACEAGTAIGAGLGAGIIIFLWVTGDVILGVIWLVTNRKTTRECPVCGTDVKKGVVKCPSCGHDFRAAAAGGIATS